VESVGGILLAGVPIAVVFGTIGYQHVNRELSFKPRPERPSGLLRLLYNPSLAALNAAKRGEIHIARREWRLALDDFDLALSHNADYWQAHLNRGAALIQVGRREESLAALQCAARLSPKQPVTWTGLANAYLALGAVEKGLETIAHGLALGVTAHGLLIRSQLHRVAGSEEQALNDLEQAVKAHPLSVDVWVAKTSSLLRLGALERALETSDDGLRRCGEWAVLMGARATCHAMAERYPEALRDYTRALTSDSGAVWARFNRAAVHLLMGQLERAAEDCAAGLLVLPNDEFGLTVQADLALHNGDALSALDCAEKALASKRNYFRGIEFAARAHDRLGALLGLSTLSRAMTAPAAL
jgi:superkiller protein 3